MLPCDLDHFITCLNKIRLKRETPTPLKVWGQIDNLHNRLVSLQWLDVATYCVGGGGESRTRVRNQIPCRLSERSLWSSSTVKTSQAESDCP